jgi:hypothetical protein
MQIGHCLSAFQSGKVAKTACAEGERPRGTTMKNTVQKPKGSRSSTKAKLSSPTLRALSGTDLHAVKGGGSKSSGSNLDAQTNSSDPIC